MASKTYTLKLKINVDGEGQLLGVEKAIKGVNKAAGNLNQTASTVDRGLKSVAGNAKNASSAFAKQAQGMGGLVHIYATVAANIWAMTAAFNVLKNAADLSIMKDAAEDLSRSTGISFAAVATNMKEITGGAISFTEAMRQANLGLSGGASSSQLAQITEIANKAANTLGLSVPNAVGRMIQAVTKGEPELVDELGIILRVTAAAEEYGATIGKTAQELTTFEKQQAIINQLITQGNDKFADVTKRTNPFEKLISDVGDISNTVLGAVSRIIGPIVAVISDNIGIIVLGLALIGQKLVSMILPTLIASAEAMAKLADEEKKIANDASSKLKSKEDQYTRITNKIKTTTAALTKFITLEDKSAKGSIKRGMEDTVLVDSIKRSTKEGKKLLKVMDSIKNKNSEDAAVLIKKSNIIKEIQLEIQRGNTSIFKKGTNVGAVQEDLESIEKLGVQQRRLNRLKGVEAANAISRQKAAQDALNATVATAVATGQAQILGNTKLSASFSIWLAAIRGVNAAYSENIVKQNIFMATSLRMQKVVKVATLTFLAMGKGISLLASKLTGVVTTVLIVFQGLKTLGTLTGVLRKEFFKAADAMSEVKDEMASAAEKFADIKDVIAETPSGLTEVVNKWTKVVNVTNQYVATLEKALEAQQFLEGASFFEKLAAGPSFWIDALSDSREGMEKIFEVIEKAAEASGNAAFTQTLELKVPGSITDAQKNQVKALEAQIKIMAGPSTYNPFKEQNAALREAIELIKQSAPLVTKLVEFSPIHGLDSFLTRANDPVSGKSFLAQVPGFMKAMQKPVNETKTSFDDLSRIFANLDKQQTDLVNKSESRRIINTDTAINFRDELKGMEVALLTIRDHGLPEGFSDIAAVFAKEGKGLNETIAKGLIPGLELGSANTSAQIAAVRNALANLDKDIDITRNAASNISILTTQLKTLKEEEKRGLDVKQSLITIQEKELKIIAQKIAAKKAEINLIGIGERVLPDDISRNLTEQAKKQAEIVALQEEYRLKNKAIIPSLAAQAVQLKRNSDLQKERGKNVDTTVKTITTLVELNKKDRIGLAKVPSLIELQTAASKRVTEEKIAQLELDKEIIKNAARLAHAENRFGAFKLENLKLDSIENQQNLLKLEQLQEELGLRKEIIEAQNQARGTNISGTEFSSSFSTGDISTFVDALRVEFGTIGDDMGQKIGNSIKQATSITVGAIEDVNSTVVDALISRTWDGKEEGRSFGKALSESLKATLRQSIGQAIKDNMTQAVVALMGTQDKQILQIQAQILELKLNTSTIAANTLARGTASSLGGTAELGSLRGFFSDTLSEKEPETSNVVLSKVLPLPEDNSEPLVEALNSNTLEQTALSGSQGIQAHAALENTLALSTSTAQQGVLGTHQSIQTTAVLENTLALVQLTASMATNSLSSSGDLSTFLLGGLGSGGLSTTNTSTGVVPRQVQGFSSGGVVSKPTDAIIGEGSNSEAIVPLPDNRSIPVKLEGDSGSNIVVSQNFDFRGADSATEARLRQFAAQIKRETTKEIFDSINRGGSAAKTVGRR